MLRNEYSANAAMAASVGQATWAVNREADRACKRAMRQRAQQRRQRTLDHIGATLICGAVFGAAVALGLHLLSLAA